MQKGCGISEVKERQKDVLLQVGDPSFHLVQMLESVVVDWGKEMALIVGHILCLSGNVEQSPPGSEVNLIPIQLQTHILIQVP